MTQITPVQYTTNGNMATQLMVTSVSDNLIDTCNFDWKLFDNNGALVDNGLLLCTGTDYSVWQGDNTYPYTFTAGRLGLTITT